MVERAAQVGKNIERRTRVENIDVMLVNCPTPGKFPGAPIGLLVVANYLRNEGFHVQVVDPCVYPNTPAEKVVDKALTDKNPRVLAISGYSPFHFDAMELSRNIKLAHPNLPIAYGGIHPTFLPGALERHPYIDYEIRGDGEYPLAELVKFLRGEREDLAIYALAYRDSNGNIVGNRLLPGSGKSSGWVSPDLSMAENLEAYSFTDLFGEKKSAQVITTRGCPYPCDFCPASRFSDEAKGPYRQRSIKCVIDELEERKNQGFKAIFFDDAVFTLDYRRVEQLTSYLEASGLEWACQTRVDRMPQELLEKMRKAGCTYIFIGFETGDQHTLDLMEKKTSPQQNWEAIENARRAGINVGVSIMLGYPGQSDEAIVPTLRKLAQYKEGVTTSLALFAYYPGTRKWTEAIHRGLFTPDVYEGQNNRGDPWSCFDEGEGAVHAPDMTEERLYRLYKQALDTLEGRVY